MTTGFQFRMASNTQHPEEVCKTIVKLARKDAWTPQTRETVGHILSDYKPTVMDLSGRWVPEALHRWGRENLFFMREPHVEVIHGINSLAPPPWGPGSGAADCDDMTAGICTALRCVGIPTWVGLVWTGPQDAHVFPVSAPGWNDRATPILNLDPLSPQVRVDPLDALSNVKLFRC